MATRVDGIVANSIAEADRLLNALRRAREVMEESGDYARAAQLSRDLAHITTSLHRLKIMLNGGAAPEFSCNEFDTASDLDARRDALARRIEIIAAEWRDAEAAAAASSG